MQIDKQVDVRILLAAFRQFAKAPKITMRIPVFGNVILRCCVVLVFQEVILDCRKPAYNGDTPETTYPAMHCHIAGDRNPR